MSAPTIEPMGPLDATFLHVEDGISHMHIGSCAIFAGPAPTFDAISHLIESKLALLVRYRQKVRFVPGGLGHPVWVDDPHFDLRYHLRHTALATTGDGGGDDDELETLLGRLMSQELDRQRPLWEAWVVEGLSEQRWALISKVHHCMVDGISGTDLMAVLLDVDPLAAPPATQPWIPAPEPSDLRLAVDAVSRLALAPVKAAGALRRQDLNPRRAMRRAGDVLAGLGSLATRLARPAKQVSVEGTIGRHRRWAAGRGTLDDAKVIGHAFGGSVNDVVLAAISGAFRALLISRGDPVDDVVFRSLVPVSVRHADDHTYNNQVSLVIAELPIGIADPVKRLHAVHQQMAELKSSHQVDAGEAVVGAAQFVPPILLALGTRAVMGVLHKVSQRSVNTVTTNVPGPQFPLYALGLPMLEYLPFVPLSEGLRIGVAILSYNGQITFGVTADYDSVPDVKLMANQIEVELRMLRERADALATDRSTS